MLADAIREYLQRRGLRTVDLAGTEAHFATVWRVLRGVTLDPRLSTFLQICRQLAIEPTELLAKAGLWERSYEPAAPTDDRADRVAALPPALRNVWAATAESLVTALEDLAKARTASASKSAPATAESTLRPTSPGS